MRLANRSNYVVRALAINALGKRTGARVERTLITLLDDQNPTLREAAATSLGHSASNRDRGRILPALLETCDDSEEAVQLASLQSLGLLNDNRALPRLCQALSAPNLRIRKQALLAIRFLDAPQAVPDVMQLLLDEDRTLVQDAGRTLERMTGMDFGMDYELWKGWWETEQEARTNNENNDDS